MPTGVVAAAAVPHAHSAVGIHDGAVHGLLLRQRSRWVMECVADGFFFMSDSLDVGLGEQELGA
jgi:hypothetical protein